MEIVCPTCNEKYYVSDDKIPRGKKASTTCKKCGGKIVIETSRNDQQDDSFDFKSEPLPSDGHEGSPQITEKDFINLIQTHS